MARKAAGRWVPPDGQETKEPASVGERGAGSSVQAGSEGVRGCQPSASPCLAPFYRHQAGSDKSGSAPVSSAGDVSKVVGNAAGCPAEGRSGEGRTQEPPQSEQMRDCRPVMSNTGRENRQPLAKPLGKSGSVADLEQSSRGGVEAISPPPGQPSKGGWDTLHVCVYGECLEGWAEIHRPILQAAKEAAEAAEKPVTFEGPEGQPLQMAPYSTFHGRKLPFVVLWDGITLQLADDPLYSENTLTAYVEIGSNPCIVHGGRGAWDQVVRVLQGFGFSIVDTKVTRADACVDLVGVGIDEFKEPVKWGRYVCAAGRGEESYRRTGVNYLEGGPMWLRIYDKVVECCKDRQKCENMAVNRWGCPGKLPEGGACRVEFEFRKASLRRRFGVVRIQDLWAKGGAMVDYAAGEWFRLTESVPDVKNGHQKRAKDSKLWERVRAYFREAFGEGCEYSGIVSEMLLDDDHARKTMGGYLRLLDVLGGKIPTVQEVSPEDASRERERLREQLRLAAYAQVDRLLDEVDPFEEVALRESRRREMESRTPCVSSVGLSRPVTDTAGDRRPGTWVF